MSKRVANVALLLGVLLSMALPVRARADMLPPPTRPDWTHPPSPIPDPPEEEELRSAFYVALIALLGAAAVHRYRASVRVNHDGT